MSNRAMSVNEVVAHNLAKARRLRRWTQEQAAERLEPHLGKRLSKAAYSAAERSAETGRTRNFNADELYAFARTFELPITFFLIPPRAAGMVGTTSDKVVAPEFIDLVFDLDEDTRRSLREGMFDRFSFSDARSILGRYIGSYQALDVELADDVLRRALSDEKPEEEQ